MVELLENMGDGQLKKFVSEITRFNSWSCLWTER